MRTSTSAAAVGAIAVTALVAGTAAGFPGAAYADTTPEGDPPSVITVDSTVDEAAADPGNGRCRTPSGACTLRAAVQTANAHPGSTIVVPAGRYVLTIGPDQRKVQGRNPDATTGDLNLTAPTTLRGAGRERTVLDANGIDRVLSIAAPTTLTGLTVTGGRTAQHEIPFYDTGGGGIANSSDLVLDDVVVRDNSAGYGGGIFNVPGSDLHTRNTVITGNSSGEAGGVRCDNTCTFTDSTISDNRVVDPGVWYRPGGFAGRGGGVDVRGRGVVTFDRVTLTGNTASDGGSGINVAPAYLDTLPRQVTDLVDIPVGRVVLRNSTVLGNRSGAAVVNCVEVFATIVSEGGNTSDDASCNLTGAGDRVVS
ncbi:CSLREA domain-containing protein [Nocardia sp. CY41]|uniref:CSLREA domain-containing protein n=1 Tax=Nocardia sp. CY41 TaxID=2608686 RepID=UPI0013598A5A|nr:CSLREA domain-containing protein [Nocardia sp. CY41]